MAMTLREILKSAGEVALTLRSGVVFRGHLGNSAEDLVQLIGEEGERHFLVATEIAAVTITHAIQAAPSPTTSAKVEYIWHVGEAERLSQAAAQKMLNAITEALRALGPDVESEIHTIQLFSGQAGRFRVTDGVLEAGFSDDEDPPPVRELQSLLAAIL